MFNIGMQGGITPPIRPNEPQVIDPRVQYERQSILADQLSQLASQYAPNSGALGAIAMMVNSFAANKAGGRAEGALSAALEQENERARQAMAAEQAAAREQLEAEFQNWMRKEQWKRENPEATAFEREAAFAGIEPGSPEARKRFTEGRGGPTVNVNSGPQGPQGPQRDGNFSFIADPNEPSGFRAVPIPGTEDAREIEESQRKAGLREERTEVTQGVMMDEINRALEVIEENPNLAAGPLSVVGQFLNVGPANRLDSALEGLKPNIAFDRLDQMRQSSPTGGAVGQLTDKERDALASVFGSLRQSQHPDDLQYNLRRLNNLLVDAQHGTPAQRQALVESGEISPELNQRINSLYMQESEQPANDEEALIRKYL